MADSKLLRILQAYQFELDGPGKPPTLNVHRHPERPLWEDELPAVVLYDAPVVGGVADRSELVRLGASPRNQRHTLNIRTEHRVKLDGTLTPDEALDPIYVWVDIALVGAEQLSGLLAQGAIRVSSSGLVVYGETEDLFAARAVDYQVVYETMRGDPTQ